MSKPYSPTSMRSIDLQFDKMKKQTDAYMVNVLKKTAKTCFMNILKTDEPPYKTGSYMSSHRIGVNEEDLSDTVIKKKGLRTLEQAIGSSLQHLRKIDSVKSASDTITISNSVGYSTKYGFSWAAKVEYVGWGDQGGRGPYLVYEKAVTQTMQQLPDIAKSVSTTDSMVEVNR
jgi:hypothetical protein